MYYLIIFILGLIIGSFINVVVWRLYSGYSIFGRSQCPYCHHQLRFWDLIPILSFLFLKGKCRYCHKPFSWQYPLVELATGLLFVFVFYQYKDALLNNPLFNDWLVLVRNLFFISVLIIIFVFDFKYYLIPDAVSIPAVIISFILNLILGYSWLNLILAGAVAGGFFLLLYLISQGKWLGGGDIRLGVLTGVMLGWPNIIVSLFIAFFLGATVGLSLIVLKVKTWKSQLPLGTFLSTANFIALFWGDRILEWYLSLL